MENQTLKALYTLDLTDNTAVLQCVGDDELMKIQKPRFEKLMEVMNTDKLAKAIAELGLPALYEQNEVVILDQAEIGDGVFYQTIGSSGQSATRIKTLSQPAIEEPEGQQNYPTCATCIHLKPDHSHPCTDGKSISLQRGWICAGMAPQLFSGWRTTGSCEMHTPQEG